MGVSLCSMFVAGVSVCVVDMLDWLVECLEHDKMSAQNRTPRLLTPDQPWDRIGPGVGPGICRISSVLPGWVARGAALRHLRGGRLAGEDRERHGRRVVGEGRGAGVGRPRSAFEAAARRRAAGDRAGAVVGGELWGWPAPGNAEFRIDHGLGRAGGLLLEYP